MSESKLLERVEAATGPDREIDARIWCALVTGETWSPEEFRQSGDEYIITRWNVPAYTASLDAALALVERMLPDALYRVEKLAPSVYRRPDHNCWASCGIAGEQEEAHHVSPALALLAALLKATEQSDV